MENTDYKEARNAYYLELAIKAVGNSHVTTKQLLSIAEDLKAWATETGKTPEEISKAIDDCIADKPMNIEQANHIGNPTGFAKGGFAGLTPPTSTNTDKIEPPRV
jgi:meiotically up-regulated gene 157 (Mug157) protein